MIRMKTPLQRLAAWIVYVPAGLVTAGSVGLLVVGHIDGCRRAPVEKARLEALEQAVKEDMLQTPALEAERERQRDASLEREARSGALANTILIAGILFLLGAKWLVVLKGRRLPELDVIVAAGRR